MRAMKAVYGLWADIQIGQLNKLLKPFGCRLVKKSSKDWGQAVSITAHALEVPSVFDTVCEHGHLWLPPHKERDDRVFCATCGWEKLPEPMVP